MQRGLGDGGSDHSNEHSASDSEEGQQRAAQLLCGASYCSNATFIFRAGCVADALNLASTRTWVLVGALPHQPALHDFDKQQVGEDCAEEEYEVADG